MDDNIETTTIEDFHNQPLKKAKYSESSILDDILPSPTISALSLVSECSESIGSESTNQINSECSEFIGSESGNQINGAPLPPPPSPSMSTLCPVSELMNEEKVSEDGDNQADSDDDDKQTHEPGHIINNVIYDYLPQGKKKHLLFLL